MKNKNFMALLLLICLAFPVFSLSSFASDGLNPEVGINFEFPENWTALSEDKNVSKNLSYVSPNGNTIIEYFNLDLYEGIDGENYDVKRKNFDNTYLTDDLVKNTLDNKINILSDEMIYKSNEYRMLEGNYATPQTPSGTTIGNIKIALCISNGYLHVFQHYGTGPDYAKYSEGFDNMINSAEFKYSTSLQRDHNTTFAHGMLQRGAFHSEPITYQYSYAVYAIISTVFSFLLFGLVFGAIKLSIFIFKKNIKKGALKFIAVSLGFVEIYITYFLPFILTDSISDANFYYYSLQILKDIFSIGFDVWCLILCIFTSLILYLLFMKSNKLKHSEIIAGVNDTINAIPTIDAKTNEPKEKTNAEAVQSVVKAINAESKPKTITIKFSKKSLVVAISCILAIATACTITFFVTKEVVSKASYKEGYKNGRDIGYELGRDSGYDSGKAQAEYERITGRNPKY